MKKIFFKSIAAAVLTVGLTGCVNDLDISSIDPQSSPSADPMGVLAKCYSTLGLTGQAGPAGKGDLSDDEGESGFYRTTFNLQELPTDECAWAWQDNQDIPQLTYMQWNSSSVRVQWAYTRLTYDITLFNSYLQQVEDNEANRLYRAEVRFLRALHYWYLLDLFGKVPFKTEFNITELPVEYTAQQIYDWIDKELTEIEPMMAEVGTYSKPGGESASLVQGQAPSSIGNDLLKWETTTQYNAGIDFTVLKGRLSLTVDAYYKDTRDLLITEQLPSVSGFQSAVRNIGRVSNKGMEFQVSSVNIDKKDFNWTTDLNISFNRNVVEEIGNGDRIAITPDPLIMDAYSDVFYVREGYPLGAMFGYVWDGVYQLQDFKEFYDAAGNFITDPALQKQIYNQGSFTLRDGVVENGYTLPKPGGFKPRKIGSSDAPVNHDEDRVYLGSTEPLFFGGITNSFTWKNWYLNIQCTFSYGNKLFNANNRLLQGRNTANISREYYESFWSIDRQDGTMPAIDDEGMKVASSMQVEDASYFKIKDVTLAYTFPRKWLQGIGVKGVRAYVSAKNLLTFTKYSWYDPEYIHPNPLMSGLDRYSYPTTVTLMCGVSLTF